jgi:mannitol-specific phosphotransferase system IIBC component
MVTSIPASTVKTIIFACEAGAGSSVVGVNLLKKKLKQANLNVNVVHMPARAIPADATVIVTHKGLAELARQKAPNGVVIAFSQFMNDPAVDKLVQSLKDGKEVAAT